MKPYWTKDKQIQEEHDKVYIIGRCYSDSEACPDRVADILEACGAFDLSSSLSRDALKLKAVVSFGNSRLFYYFPDLIFPDLII